MNIKNVSPQWSFTARLFAGITIVSLFLSAFPVAFFVAEAVVADPPGTLRPFENPFDNPQGKVKICHWDAEAQAFANDNQQVNVSSAVNGSGHGGHANDIIPPFWHQLNDQAPMFYPGLNWDEVGKEIYDNNCSIPSISGSISGTKYNDVGNDGSISGDSGSEGWTIRLYAVDTAWVLVETTTTDAGGEFWFEDLLPGEYKVCEVMKEHWTQTFVTNGIDNESPNASEEGPKCRTVNIDKDDEQNTVNFGNYYDEPVDPVYGCMDPDASNYNSEATEQGDVQCEYPPIRCENLLTNGSFEEPVVTNQSLWQKFAGVVGWVIEKVSDDTPTTLEIHRNWSGNDAANGNQYVELDGDHSTKISQTVSTTPGAVYELKWAFAPRHNITAEQNQLSVLVNGVEEATEGPATGSAGLEPGDWTLSSYQFTADNNQTTVTFSDAGPSNSYGTFLDDAQLCLVREPEPEPCEPEEHVFADNVENNSQGLTKGGAAVAVGRSNPTDATSDPDWTSGGSTGFYSLGFGGWIVVSFDKFVVNVDGDDLSVHEATNGTYPLEKAKVEVSQDGSTWYALTEEARNDSSEGGSGVTLLDFDETGLAWIKYVRLTDMTDSSLHNNQADGFDLDTVDATYVVCDEPEDPDVPEGKVKVFKWVKNQSPWDVDFEDFSFQIGDFPTSSFNQWGFAYDYVPVGEEYEVVETDIPEGYEHVVTVCEVIDKKPEIQLQDTILSLEGPEEEIPLELSLYKDAEPLQQWPDNTFELEDEDEMAICLVVNKRDYDVPPPMCSLDIVSDEGTVVVENNAFAQLTYVHNAWTADLNNGNDAEWVWESYAVADPDATTTLTFKETFEVTGGHNASLSVAADNSYKAWLNGNLVIDESDEANNFNFLNQDKDVDVSGFLVDGTNTLLIEVTNHGGNYSNYMQNPAGVLYRLTLDGDEESCEITTDIDEEEDMYLIDGYKHEQGDDFIAFLSGWTIELYDDEGFVMSTTTDTNGYYYFYVGEGEYEVKEVMQEGWEQVGVSDGGDYVYPEDGPHNCAFTLPLEDDEYPVFNSISLFIQDEEYTYSEYRCSFFNQRIDNNGGDDGDGDGDGDEEEQRPFSSGTRVSRPTPQVLGETVSQCEFLKEYMQMGEQNNSFEVTKLQMFLSIVMGYEQPVTGRFGTITDANVKRFQETFRSEILDPWFNMGIVPHSNPTGFVYKLTKWKINDIVCPGWDPYPSFDGENLQTNVDIDSPDEDF